MLSRRPLCALSCQFLHRCTEPRLILREHGLPLFINLVGTASSDGGTAMSSARRIGRCLRNLLHSSQGFDETAIAQAYNTDAGVVQVDRHPQSDRKNDPVNGVEQRKPATHTTIAEA